MFNLSSSVFSLVDKNRSLTSANKLCSNARGKMQQSHRPDNQRLQQCLIGAAGTVLSVF